MSIINEAYKTYLSNPTQYSDPFYKALYQFVRKSMPRIPPGVDPEDVVQDSVVRIWEKLPSFKGDSEFSTWVTRVLRSQFADSLRRESPRSQLDADLEEAEGLEAEPTELPIESQERIDKLGPELKQIVLLRLEGYNESQIGEHMGLSQQTVSNRLKEIKERLKCKS